MTRKKLISMRLSEQTRTHLADLAARYGTATTAVEIAIDRLSRNGNTTPSLYWSPSLPDHWIAEVDGELWLFPSCLDGWQKRTLYWQGRRGLRQVDTYVLPAISQLTGWEAHP
jgi:hypothetical protein